MTEEQQQAKCVIYFNNQYPHFRGRLFRTENQTNKNKTAIGLVKGVSDLQFVLSDGRLVPLENKVNYTRHDVLHLERQLIWLSDIKKLSGLAFFFFSYEHFKMIIDLLVRHENTYQLLQNESDITIEYINKLISDNYEKKTVKLNFSF